MVDSLTLDAGRPRKGPKQARCPIRRPAIYSRGVCKNVRIAAPRPRPLPPPAAAEIQLPIEGMSCASCVNRIERYLRKTPGVAEANVNLATEVATVRYLPEIAGLDELARAIEAAGYEVRHLPEPAAGGARASLVDEADAEAADRAREQRTLGLAAAASLAVAALTMLVMYVPTAPLDDGAGRVAAHRPGHVRPVLGRPPLLPRGLAGGPPRRHEHGHARRRRHQRGLGVQRRS